MKIANIIKTLHNPVSGEFLPPALKFNSAELNYYESELKQA